MKVLIAGAGIFGVTAALTLRARGHEVTLLDPGPLPHPRAASTDISKVIRMDYGADGFYTALMERALTGWRRWNAGWPRPLYHETGFLLLTGAPMAPGGFEGDSFDLLTARGHALERLDSAALAVRSPDWTASRYPDGYLNPAAGWAESGAVVAALLGEAARAGVTPIEGATFSRLLESDDRVLGLETRDGRRLRADCVVVAAGCWTAKLLPELGDAMWATGQPVLHFQTDPTRFAPPRFLPWAADISRTGWYGFPAKADGALKIANHGPGQRLDPDAPRAVPDGTEVKFRAFLRDNLPALADAPVIGSRLCVYCDTFDGDFFIGALRPGLVVAAGGSGHGFKFAPVLGEITACAVEGRDHPAAARFAPRARGDLRTEDARFDG